MIPEHRIPHFDDTTGQPSHWFVPARDDTTEDIDKRGRYTSEAVEEHRNKPINAYEDVSKAKSVKRHYIQNEAVSEQQVRILLDRLDIPTDSSWLLYAGFTGELGGILSDNLGGDLIFTDPLQTWVDKAANRGIKAIQTRLQTCDGDHFASVDGVTTFEGYEATHTDGDLLYEGLRCLTTEHGLTFFQSKFTRDCTRSTGNGTSIKGRIKAFEKAYPGVESCYRENDGLRAYHMSADDSKTRARILKDYLIIYLLASTHRSKPKDGSHRRDPITLTEELVADLPEKLNVTYQEATQAHARIATIDYHQLDQVDKNYTQRHNIAFPLKNRVLMIENTTRPY